MPATAIRLSTLLLQALVANREVRVGGGTGRGSGTGRGGDGIISSGGDRTGGSTTASSATSGGPTVNSSSHITAAIVGHNEMHGFLTLIAEPLATLNRRLVGLKLLDNHVFYTQRKTELSENLLPVLAALLSELSVVACPPVHYVFLRILRTVVSLLTNGGTGAGGGVEGGIAKALLLGECRVTLHPVLLSLQREAANGAEEGVSKGVLPLKGGALPPYAPTVYREALSDLMYYSLLAAATTRESPSHTLLPTTTNQPPSDPSSSSDHPSSTTAPFGPYPINASLWSLLQHPMSEIREGMLLGCLRALSSETSGNCGVDDVEYTLVARLLSEREELLSMLLTRLNVETEPPIRILTLHLLCDLTRRRPLCAMKPSRKQTPSTHPTTHQISLQTTHQTTYELFTSTDTWRLLTALATASTQGLGVSQGPGAPSEHKGEPLANNDASVRALEVMGWIIGGGRRGLSKGRPHGEESRVNGWLGHPSSSPYSNPHPPPNLDFNPHLNHHPCRHA